MTEDELFVQTLSVIKDRMVEERKEMTRMDGANGIIAREYDEGISLLNRVIPKIQDIFSVYELEEEDFLYVLDCFEKYMESFVVDGTDPVQKEKDLELFEQLSSIIDEFYVDEDEEADDTDEDED